MNILITEKEFQEYRTLQKQLSQLQQEREELINWLMKLVEECDELVILNSICAGGTKRTEDIAKLRKIVYQEILSKLKESKQ